MVRDVRVRVHVQAGSKVVSVGGTHGGDLKVRIRARAVDGAASAEVLRVVAAAFGLGPTSATLVRGTRSRSKVIDLEGPESALARRLEELRGSDGEAATAR